MNERQRDLFLWVWSRRRQPGRAAIGLRGALIGAAGGLAFGLILFPPGADLLKLFGMSIGAFGFIGWMGADRVFALQEAQYRAILATGAQVPAEKPVMQPGDRGPAIAVAVVAVLIVGFILTLVIMAATGAL